MNLIKKKRFRPVEFRRHHVRNSFFSKPSIYHALIVIFLEFFAFGLLTTPMISILDETFPQHTFLINGLVQGVKGFLSFLSAPLIGALSDVFGRKPLLLLTVTFTCIPIPLMRVSHWWYFTIFSMSGIFSVTFSVVFAFVADITRADERSYAYGLVSATFAASFVVSPAIGAYLGKLYSDNFVIALASAVALLDIFFILIGVPESLPEKRRLNAKSSHISWEQTDPFGALKRISSDRLILFLCIITFLSFLPEAGEYSCFFVYLRLVVGFSEQEVALFIAVVGMVSCIAQTLIMGVLMEYIGPKLSIIAGLVCEMLQLLCYGFGQEAWILWSAAGIAGLGSLTYPAISAFVSQQAEEDQQGVAQGMLTGIRGLCNGLGPALFGILFYAYQVDLTAHVHKGISPISDAHKLPTTPPKYLNSSAKHIYQRSMPGPPFVYGAVLVMAALVVACYLPESLHNSQLPVKSKLQRSPRMTKSSESDVTLV